MDSHVCPSPTGSPSVLWHGDRFHLVWSSDLCVGQIRGQWKCHQLPPKGRPLPRFGYAHSADLVNWRDVRLVEVPLEGACSLWAPELSAVPHAEGGGLQVTFSAAIARDAPCPPTFRKHKHSGFWLRSADMHGFTPPRRLQLGAGPDESSIDLFPLLGARAATPGEPPHLLFYKSEHNACKQRVWSVGSAPRAAEGQCTLVLRQASSWNASGPWRPAAGCRGGFVPGAISRPCVEGPSPIRLHSGETLLLFDAYREDCTLLAPPPCDRAGVWADAGLRLDRAASAAGKGTPCAYVPARKGFGALLSSDLCTWTDVSSSIEAPANYKHGTAISLHGAARRAACGAPDSPLAGTIVCAAPAAAG